MPTPKQDSLSNQTEFLEFLTRITQTQPPKAGFQPIEGAPVVRVVNEKNQNEYYALWRKGENFALVSILALANIRQSVEPPVSQKPSGPNAETVVKFGWSYTRPEQDQENEAKRRRGEKPAPREQFIASDSVEVFYNPVTRKKAEPGMYWTKTGEWDNRDGASFIGKSGYTFDADDVVSHPEKGELRPIPRAFVDRKAFESAGQTMTDTVLATDLRRQGYTYIASRELVATPTPVASVVDPKRLQAIEQSQLNMMAVGAGQKPPAISIPATALSGLKNVSIEMSDYERQMRQAIATAQRAQPNSTSEPSRPVIVQQDFAKAAVAAPLSEASLLQKAPSLNEMKVIAIPAATIEDNHTAAVTASNAIRDKKLDAVQIKDVIISFRALGLDGFADALEKQSKAADPIQGWRTASGEIHKVRQILNAEQEQREDAARAVNPADILAGAMARMGDPAVIAEAMRGAASVLSGMIGEGQKNETIFKLFTDGKTQAAMKNVMDDAKLDITKLPPATQNFLLERVRTKMLENRDEILKGYDPKNIEPSRLKLESVVLEELKKAFKEIKPDGSRFSPTSLDDTTPPAQRTAAAGPALVQEQGAKPAAVVFKV